MKLFSCKIIIFLFVMFTAVCGCENFINDYISDVNMYRIAAAVDGGYIYTSFDNGQSWVERQNAGSRSWTSITSSANGMHVAACAPGANIWTSNNGGVKWVERTSATYNFDTAYMQSIACSYSGKIILAASNANGSTGYLYCSRDGGVTWSRIDDAGQNNWTYAALSGDGNTAGCVGAGTLYLSTGDFTTWTAVPAPVEDTNTREVSSVALSYDGTAIYLGVINGYYVHFSFDKGVNWSSKYETGNSNYEFRSAATSCSGSYYVNVVSNSFDIFFYSKEQNACYTAEPLYGTSTISGWQSVAMSACGECVVAVPAYGYIWLLGDYGKSWKALESAGKLNWKAVTMSRYKVPVD